MPTGMDRLEPGLVLAAMLITVHDQSLSGYDRIVVLKARQRMASILIRYGKAIFDTPHPVARRADLAAMIGTSRVMMGRALRDLEADGLVKREHGGGIKILDEQRLAGLVTVAAPDGAPAL